MLLLGTVQGWTPVRAGAGEGGSGWPQGPGRPTRAWVQTPQFLRTAGLGADTPRAPGACPKAEKCFRRHDSALRTPALGAENCRFSCHAEVGRA